MKRLESHADRGVSHVQIPTPLLNATLTHRAHQAHDHGRLTMPRTAEQGTTAHAREKAVMHQPVEPLPDATVVMDATKLLTVTQNLDERCYSLRDFLAVSAAARLARHPLDDLIDRLLDMAGA